MLGGTAFGYKGGRFRTGTAGDQSTIGGGPTASVPKSSISNLIVAIIVVWEVQGRMLFLQRMRWGPATWWEGGSGKDPHHIERAVLSTAHQGNHFVTHPPNPRLLAGARCFAPTGSWSHRTAPGAVQTKLQPCRCSPSAKQGSCNDVCNEEEQERHKVRRRSKPS